MRFTQLNMGGGMCVLKDEVLDGMARVQST